MRISSGLILVATVAYSLAARALPLEAAVPGGIVLVHLGKSAQAPQAWFQDKRVAVLRDRGGWVALVGLPLGLEPGVHEVRVVVADGTEVMKPLHVAAKHYALQRFTVPDRRKVEPLPEDVLRIAREQKRINEIKAAFHDVEPDLAFRQPVPGRLSSNFGLRRIINGLARNPHAGIDVAVPVGTPVLAAGAGVVVDTGDYFFNGNSVYIDHGQGVVTLYCHLERSNVRPGEPVAAGQRIGLSGNTGRTSGPHLHWTVIANGTAVDPRLFLPKAVK